MIKKTTILLVCSVTSVLSAEKLEFMKNGPKWGANMTVNQKLEFMRNRGQTSEQVIDITKQETNSNETKPIETNFTIEIQKDIKDNLGEDDLLTENELLNYAINLSLDDSKPINEEEPSKDNQPIFNETIQKIVNVPASAKNIIINYNVTINQKLKDSSQNINIGKKNNNS